MRTAITLWNDRVSPVFDVTGKALLYDAEGERVCSEKQLVFPDARAAEKVACLLEEGVEVLICGAISRDALTTAINAGLRVYPFIAGDIREVLQACLTGRLIEGGFAMPGCARGTGCHGRRGHGRGRGRVPGSAFFRKQ